MKKILAIISVFLMLFSTIGIHAFAAKTPWEPIVNVKSALQSNYQSPEANSEQYTITLGWFTTNKTVTLGTSMTTNSLYGVSKDDAKRANKMARFDVTVKYNGKNACYTRRYTGLKAGEKFKLDGKKWNESKKYTITVKSYFVDYSTRYSSSCHCNYRIEY